MDPPPAMEETTLDEPVSVTLKRELNTIADKMYKVAMPSSDSKTELRNWDLWGPLILCLILAILLSTGTSHSASKEEEHQSAGVFAAVFVIVWCGAAVVTVNAVLLGGTVSFFQSICVLGYCIFPLCVAAILCMGTGWSGCSNTVCVIIRLVSAGIALTWSTKASQGFLSEVVPPKRSALAAYPVYLFYVALAWIILIRSSP
mmetsp:Transcript_34472/g.71152  ORF Transcript_34472/g.71152 Transcript_34472/m.71152 type:complete len:202 (-) Transcript_34472:99-704(-)|eukprot:CAMPEP_0181347560 /NCGR_PEP_ID=MMETSP1101-20121128/33943_1 /TAXON_ID=46948 /ORGANISM="Rhodomonas abbreviata, Strain Caron Lab Isolate" /LENGTH=201 /DNA_ID=CAMNT_0023459781 /DNA_START=113 /DNA_END=718 /DNA_ORIENTATION=+